MMMLKPADDGHPQENTTPSYWRQAPHNIQAEQALLGAILVNNAALDRIVDIVVPADFYDPLHAEIFSVAAAMITSGKSTTPVTLRTFFENAEPINEHLTVPQYLGRLATAATTVINAPDYARTVHDLATRRRLILIGEDMVCAAYDAAVDHPPELMIEEAERELCAVAERGSDHASHTSTFAEALIKAVDLVDAAYKSGTGLQGIATGLVDLDRRLGGLAPGKLYILAGRPAMGKSALATTIAYNVAKSGAARVDFDSLEMGDEEIAMRIAAMETGVSASKYSRGLVDEMQFGRLVATVERIKGTPLFFDTRGGVSIQQLMARARRRHRQHKTGLIVIDYLQLMRSSSRKGGENRVQELTEITSGLKALAKELQVPILALSQLSRAVETREDKRPMLSDLRESGSIEQDADVVMFVYREEYYIERKKPSEGDVAFLDWQKEMLRAQGKAEVIIGKNRGGRVGTVDLAFVAELTMFGNLAVPNTMGGAHV